MVRHELVAKFPEVGVEGEGGPQAGPAHDLEADAIDQAQRPTGRQHVSADCGLMNVGRHPDDLEDRDDVTFENPQGLEPQPPEDESRGFDEDIVVSHEFGVGSDKSFPYSFGGRVVHVGGVEEAEESACIDKELHGF